MVGGDRQGVYFNYRSRCVQSRPAGRSLPRRCAGHERRQRRWRERRRGRGGGGEGGDGGEGSVLRDEGKYLLGWDSPVLRRRRNHRQLV